jgi:hypothetical protein
MPQVISAPWEGINLFLPSWRAVDRLLICDQTADNHGSIVALWLLREPVAHARNAKLVAQTASPRPYSLPPTPGGT